MKKEELPIRQLGILNMLIYWGKEKGYQPSREEIGKQFDISASRVSQVVDLLVRKGFIGTHSRTCRNLNIL